MQLQVSSIYNVPDESVFQYILMLSLVSHESLVYLTMEILELLDMKLSKSGTRSGSLSSNNSWSALMWSPFSLLPRRWDGVDSLRSGLVSQPGQSACVVCHDIVSELTTVHMHLQC